MIKVSKAISLFIVVVVYIAAFMAGLIAYQLLSGSPLFAFFIADVAATVVVWFCGLVFKNASLYDPYWSVAPIVLLIGFVTTSNHFDTVSVLYLIAFALWGTRLTLNWVIGWPGMAHQDWRYTMLRQQNPKLWFLTNFFGINMMPTLIVFSGLLPAYFCILHASRSNAVTFLGAAICLFAATLQLISDAQMRRFRAIPGNSGKNMASGLWRYSRHPNYLGEVLFWWGVWVIQMSVLPALWWTIFAPVAMTLLFLFISIPMMEKRLLASKEGYAAYKKSTSMLLLLPNGK